MSSIFDIVPDARPLQLGRRAVATWGELHSALSDRISLISEIEHRALAAGERLTLAGLIAYRVNILGKRQPVGPPKTPGYDLAFYRWHVAQTHTQSEAFDTWIAEMTIPIFDERDRANRWEAFRKALQRRRRDYERT